MKIQKKVLVVEDEKSLRDALVDILILKNFVPLEAINGRDGVRVALEKHPDLILLDLIMPEMDGMTALKNIRQNKWGKTVPIIILTNLSATKERQEDTLITDKLTRYLIKSDWKLYDIANEIEKILNP